METLGEVLRRIQKAGLKLRREKCVFMAPSVVYLRYRIDAQGLHPMPDKVKAVMDAPQPTTVTDLVLFRTVNYYGKFLPNISTILAPLYTLLRKSEPWKWSDKQQSAFDKSKQLLTSSQLLVHFDPSKELILSCDASQYGIGAVLAHRFSDGSEKPIGFVSRTLTVAEKNYSQIEREGLACVFGVKRFHSYLYGHKFELVTDHKPLITLFSEEKAVSPQPSGRIQRLSLTLGMYEYTISFKPTSAHGNADALSRLPLPVQPAQTPEPLETVLLMEQLASSPVTAQHIRAWTGRDPLLSHVLQFVQNGWPEIVDADSLKPFWRKSLELSCQEGCILWGNRVVIPKPGRTEVLHELHGGHPGETRMKRLARMFVLWPGITQDIEDKVKKCTECQKIRPNPPVAPLMPWKWPNRPWTRVHIDFAGPFLNHMFFILIDSHSKWIEVHPLSSITASATI